MLEATADMPLVLAARNVVTVAVTEDNQIKSSRQWAFGRCLSADQAGVDERSERMSGGRGASVRSGLTAALTVKLEGVVAEACRSRRLPQRPPQLSSLAPAPR